MGLSQSTVAHTGGLSTWSTEVERAGVKVKAQRVQGQHALLRHCLRDATKATRNRCLENRRGRRTLSGEIVSRRYVWVAFYYILKVADL